MQMESRSTPPPACSMLVLASDLLAQRATELLAQLAFAGTWEPGVQLKNALECYQEVRLGRAIRGADPQRMQIIDPPAPTTERSVRQ